jgi:hypothetical protein
VPIPDPVPNPVPDPNPIPVPATVSASLVDTLVGDGKSPITAFRPAIQDAYGVKTWRRTTEPTGKEKFGDPVSLSIAVDQATMLAIQADPKYAQSVVVVVAQ